MRTTRTTHRQRDRRTRGTDRGSLLGSGGVKSLMIAVVGLLFATSPARADDIVAYQADGDADAGAVDARVVALDEAFRQAVSQAINDVVDPEVRRQNKPVLDRELIGRERMWV